MNPHFEFAAEMFAGYAVYEFVLRRYWRLDAKSLPVRMTVLLAVITAASARHFSGVSGGVLFLFVLLYAFLEFTLERRMRVKKELMLEAFAVKNFLAAVFIGAACSAVSPNAVSPMIDGIWNVMTGGLRLPAGRTALYVAGFAFAADGGTMIVRGVLNKFPKLQMNALTAVRSKGKKTAEEAAVLDREEERTGELLGILERWLILIFVLAGNYGAVAFVFAAKSVARFSVLDDKDFAEYYLLGTLLSVGTAVAAGILINSLL